VPFPSNVNFKHKVHEGNHKVHNKIGVSIVNFVEYLWELCV